MLVVTICIFIALLLTILDSKKIIGWGMKVGFILIGILLAIHYDYGNDYMGYYNRFNNIIYNHYSLSSILEGNYIRNNEYGWGIINYFFTIFGKDGFFLMVAILTTIQTYIYYKAIKKHVARSWWWFAVLIYLFNTAFFMMEFSMMRQSFVMAIFLYLFDWIEKRKIIPTLIVIFILTTIHSSAAILYPFAFLGYIPKKGGAFYGTIIIVLFIFCFLSQSLLSSIFNNFLQVQAFSDYVDIYGRYKVERSYGAGFLIMMFPFIISIYYLFSVKNISRSNLLIILLSCTGYILLPFEQLIPLIARIGYYFTMFSILCFPLIYKVIKEKYLRNSLIALQCILTIYGYFIFFSNPVWIKNFTDFKTIFSVL